MRPAEGESAGSKHLALLIPEKTAYGTVYYPANRLAVDLAGLAGCRAIPEERFPYIRSLSQTLGFEIRQLNGEPIQQKPCPLPQAVDLEA